jgi:hypothetical protein
MIQPFERIAYVPIGSLNDKPLAGFVVPRKLVDLENCLFQMPAKYSQVIGKMRTRRCSVFAIAHR